MLRVAECFGWTMSQEGVCGVGVDPGRQVATFELHFT